MSAASSSNVDAELAAIRPKFAAAGQEHVFTFLDKGELNDEQKHTLLHDLKLIDVANLKDMLEHALEQEKSASGPVEIKPFTDVHDTAKLETSTLQQNYTHGLSMIADGKCAVCVMAGGQGTRLGSSAPKGCYDIGLPSHKSIFQLQCERLLRLRQLAAQHTAKDVATVNLPYFVMTSVVTYDATVAFFKQHNYFGLAPAAVHFFNQAELPALTTDGGKILMESKCKVSLGPNGNGGIYEALGRSGNIDVMEKQGIQFLHVIGVDNVLVKLGDPSFFGFVAGLGADCANKVVLKTEPKEKVGVMALRNGVPAVVEYSEIPEAMSALRNEKTGELLYSAGNIANHLFSVEFLHRITKARLPFHIARKALAFMDVKTGISAKPSSPNAIKLEMFVFDVFHLAKRVVAYAVPRSSNFSPVKNASAAGVLDSPATALNDAVAYHKRQVVAAGGVVQDAEKVEAKVGVAIPTSNEFEISPLVSYDGEGLEERVRGKTFTTPFHLQ